MTEPPVRVLLWSPRGSGEQYNGPASFTYRLYSSAPANRVKVSLVHGWPGQDDYPLFDSQHYINDYRKSPIHMLQFIRRGYSWLNSHAQEFDVMHAINAFHVSVLPAAHARTLDLPAVVFVANHQTQLSDKAGVKRLLGLARKRRQLVKELGGMIAMSKAIYEELRGYGIPQDKIAQIPMGVNTRIFFPAESEAAKSDLRSELGWLDLPTIIFVGGVVRRKRPDLIIDALHILKDRGLDCQLVIVGPEGDAAYSKEMRARATEYHVTDRVVWYGFAKDISRLFRAADYFCLPSSNEGMSAALIEAMASGLPAIVTPISGSTDAVEDDKSGRFIHADANMIADVVGEYVSDSRLAKLHGMAARQRVEERFSSEAVFSAYERMFRRIMAGKSAAE